MAAANIGGSVIGRPIEIVHADHQNKPDIAATVARRWYDRDGVDMITDLPVTAIGLAVQQVARERGRTVMITAAATSDFTAKHCSPTSTHWADDTHALTAGTARAVIENGGKSWFFITVDHAFGVALQTETTQVVQASGGTVLGAVRHPIGAMDYAGYLLQAQSSGAQVVGLASVGGDLINAIKQAAEFGLGAKSGQQLATFLTYITDIHALGLPVTQGLTFASSFYWDQNDAARGFAKRFAAERHGAMPTRTRPRSMPRPCISSRRCSSAAAPTRWPSTRPCNRCRSIGRPPGLDPGGRAGAVRSLALPREATGAECRRVGSLRETSRYPQAEAFLPANAACTVA